MNKLALITGATSGIGKATARLFAKNNINLILCGRRKERLEALQSELGNKVAIHTLCFDIRDRKATSEAIENLPENVRAIDILVNNAGNAHGLSKFQDGDIDDWEAMIDINVKGLLYVSKAVVPGMIERQSGHIINIGSIAGKEVYPNGNVYCASKFAVDALNKSMLIDLNGHGIRVGAVNPGLVDTEFSSVRFKGDQEKANQVYQNMQPLVAEDIADIILFAVTRPPHVNIWDMSVFPTAQAGATIVHRDSQI
ncbi:SDR family NAD(P)-dependent oxidoreductase [Rapidithrix thailandica]|uniref:SDR family NAD(P)-dependent oxidoreductase n=1 Tax=Rapidithrix thailandica TaxID=413964 RepID=A0AAW9SAX6_9BACT